MFILNCTVSIVLASNIYEKNIYFWMSDSGMVHVSYKCCLISVPTLSIHSAFIISFLANY